MLDQNRMSNLDEPESNGDNWRCPICEAILLDEFCSKCEVIVARPGGQERILDQRLPILIILFGVMGVLGLPLLWMSRAFRFETRIILSIVVVIYTCLLAFAAYFACSMAWEAYAEFIRMSV